MQKQWVSTFFRFRNRGDHLAWCQAFAMLRKEELAVAMLKTVFVAFYP
jgi:hypothetical protein